jgi:hypothetical protein
MTGELGWDHAISDIPEAGLTAERTATPEELAAIARALDLVACRSLTARYAIAAGSGGHYHLTGTLQAQVEQTCVVTVEPLVSDIAESFDIDFWPENELPAPGGGVVDLHEEPDLEPIDAGRIPVGRIVFECLAGAIDLFPRKSGAAFEMPAQAESGKPASPFAVLARIRSKS